MALSNWDTLAFDHEGKICYKNITNKQGNILEIYKNWVFIKAPKMWYEGCEYNEPIIAEFWEGEIHLANFEIFATRGRQESIFVFAIYKDDNDKTQLYSGIGSYVYDDDEGWVGVSQTTFEEFLEWLNENFYDQHCERTKKWFENIEKAEIKNVLG